MASYPALRSLLSKSVCPKLRALATAPSLSRSFNTNAVVRDSEDDERGYNVNRRRDDFAPGPFSDVYDPFTPPRSLSHVLNLMDRIMEDPIRGMGALGALRRSWDIKETDDALHLRVDMPGLSKEDVKVRMEENTLIIRGEEKNVAEDEEARRYISRIDLPEKIYKTDGIKAEMSNGVLKITVPKLKEEERGDVVNITVE